MANSLHSAAKRMHMSACCWALNSDIALLPKKAGVLPNSQSSAGHTVPVMNLSW